MQCFRLGRPHDLVMHTCPSVRSMELALLSECVDGQRHRNQHHSRFTGACASANPTDEPNTISGIL